MDRLDAMRVFVAALDEGSLAAAGRRLGRSPAAVTRAIALLEARVGTPLLHRTTRSIRPSEAGTRYAAACRRVLEELDAAELVAGGERAAPRGTLAVTAPLVSGARVLRPILDAFLDAEPAVRARLLLLDRPVNLVEEGIDIALRIAHLADSSMVAIRIGAVRSVVCAAPGFLAGRSPIAAPADLAAHPCIATGGIGRDEWRFPAAEGGSRGIRIAPRLLVNSIEAALESAVEGRGIVRVFSYQAADHVRAGRLALLLEDAEPAPLPVHLVTPEGRLAVPKVRAFADFAVPRLRAEFARLALPRGA